MAEWTTDRAPVHRDARFPSRERIAALFALFLLEIVSVVPWRPNNLYSGGTDPVVLAKAALAVCALVGALVLAMRTRVRMPVGLAPAGVISLALLISLLGAFVSGNGSASVVLVVRVFMVMATLLLLMSCAPWATVLGCLFTAMTALAVVAAATGLRTYSSGGRLGGGIPQIHPNELAALAATPLVGLVILALKRGWTAWRVVMVVVLIGIVVASGSRTALLGLVAALLLTAILNGIRDRSLLYVVLACTPLVYAAATFTSVIGNLASRGGSNAVSTSLDSRFTAWQVVLGWDWGSWQRWLGVGLSVTQVPVNNKWHPEQVLDSSWVSLLAQGGVLSVILVGTLVIWTTVTALVSVRRRSVLLPLLILLLVRSATESGLVDSAMPFVLLVVYTGLLTRRSRRGRAEGIDQPEDRAVVAQRRSFAVR